jgi:hypothetical protein
LHLAIAAAVAAGGLGFAATASAAPPPDQAVSGITGAGTVTLELAPESSDDVGFSSREVTTVANRPTLTLTVAGG